MKKEYIKPEMQVVELQHHCQILAGSNNRLTGTSTTGLDPLDDLDIDDEEVGTGFWGR